MITELGLGLVSSAGYLWTARYLFGRWHVHQQERPTHFRHFCGRTEQHACCYKDQINAYAKPDGLLTFFAMITAAFWPLIIPVAIVRWNPPLSSSEKEAELAKREKWIAEQEALLDKELDRGDRDNVR